MLRLAGSTLQWAIFHTNLGLACEGLFECGLHSTLCILLTLGVMVAAAAAAAMD